MARSEELATDALCRPGVLLFREKFYAMEAEVLISPSYPGLISVYRSHHVQLDVGKAGLDLLRECETKEEKEFGLIRFKWCGMDRDAAADAQIKGYRHYTDSEEAATSAATSAASNNIARPERTPFGTIGAGRFTVLQYNMLMNSLCFGAIPWVMVVPLRLRSRRQDWDAVFNTLFRKIIMGSGVSHPASLRE